MSVDPTMFQFRTFAETCDLFNMSSNELLHFYEIGAIDIAIKVDGASSFDGKAFHSLTAKMTREQAMDLGRGHLSRRKMKGGVYELSGFWFLDDLINRERRIRNIKQIISNNSQSIADFKEKVKEARFSGVIDEIRSKFGWWSRIKVLRSADLSRCSPWRRKIEIDLPVSPCELEAFILNKDLKVLQEAKKNKAPPVNLFNYPCEWGVIDYAGRKFRDTPSIATIRAYQEGFYRVSPTKEASPLENPRKTTPRLKALISKLASTMDPDVYNQLELESTSDYTLLIDIINYIPEIDSTKLIHPNSVLKEVNHYLSAKSISGVLASARSVVDWIKAGKKEMEEMEI